MTCFGGAVNRNNFYFLILFLHHYMFRPLQAIFRWIYTVVLEAITPTTDQFLGYTVNTY
jgi:hypothetical protein